MSLLILASSRHLVRTLAARQPSLMAAPATITPGKCLVRWISSTDKKPATHVGHPPDTVIDNPPRTAEDFAEAAKKPRNWISYGFSTKDITEDRDNHAAMMFFMLTCSLIGGSFFIAYFPDWKNIDWAHREAYLELARREKYGLPLIDKELIPVDKIVLPTEEELVGKDVFL